MKKLLLLAVIPTFAVAAQESLSLDSYLKQVEEANLSIRSIDAQAQGQVHRVKPAGTWDDPFIAGGPDELPFSGGGNGVIRYQLSQNIPFPGKLSSRQEAAGKRAELIQANARTTRREIKIDAMQIFLQNYFNLQALKLNEQISQLLKDITRVEKTRYRTAGSGHHSYLLARAEQGILNTEKTQLLRRKKALWNSLNLLRNSDPASTPPEVDLNLPDIPVSYAPPALEKLLEDQPELLAAMRTVEYAQAELSSANKAILPDFMLQGMVMQSRHGSEPSNYGFMAGINMPIFWWRKQSEIVHAVEREKEASLYQKDQLVRELQNEYRDAVNEFDASKTNLDLYEKEILPMTRMALASSKTDYMAGRATIREYLDVVRASRQQELDHLAVRLDLYLARMRVENLLSAPPMQRFSPGRPTLFNSTQMGTMQQMQQMPASNTIRTGKGMRSPAPASSTPGMRGM